VGGGGSCGVDGGYMLRLSTHECMRGEIHTMEYIATQCSV
jgi:hypothetical protein